MNIEMLHIKVLSEGITNDYRELLSSCVKFRRDRKRVIDITALLQLGRPRPRPAPSTAATADSSGRGTSELCTWTTSMGQYQSCSWRATYSGFRTIGFADGQYNYSFCLDSTSINLKYRPTVAKEENEKRSLLLSTAPFEIFLVYGFMFPQNIRPVKVCKGFPNSSWPWVVTPLSSSTFCVVPSNTEVLKLLSKRNTIQPKYCSDSYYVDIRIIEVENEFLARENL